FSRRLLLRSTPFPYPTLFRSAAAGMTAIFGTPLAAILLAIEVLLFEWKPRSFVPVVVGVIVAFAWRPWLIGSGAMFPFVALTPTDRKSTRLNSSHVKISYAVF